jgi:hypothetical protein
MIEVGYGQPPYLFKVFILFLMASKGMLDMARIHYILSKPREAIGQLEKHLTDESIIDKSTHCVYS